jgi:hypothetical protein
MGERRKAYRLLVGKPGGRRPLGRPRRRWVDNIRIEYKEQGTVQSTRSKELCRVQGARNCAEYKMEGTVQSTRSKELCRV